MMHPQKVLITGADGFVGRIASARLRAADCETVRVVRKGGCSGDVVVGDLAAFEGWQPLLSGVDAVLHLAGRAHVIDEKALDPLAEFRRTNVDATMRLAEAAARAGVHRFIFVSSIGVNGVQTGERPFSESDPPEPSEPYALSKLEAEQGLARIADHGAMQVTRIRPPLILGPGVKGNLLRLMRLVDRGIPLPFGAIRNRRSFIAVDDLCDLIYLCLGREGSTNELFVAASGEEISTPDLMHRIAAALGRALWLVPVPMIWLRAAAGLTGTGPQFARFTSSLRVDASRARTVLNWRPRTSLSTAIRSMAETYLQEKKRECGIARP